MRTSSLKVFGVSFRSPPKVRLILRYTRADCVSLLYLPTSIVGGNRSESSQCLKRLWWSKFETCLKIAENNYFVLSYVLDSSLARFTIIAQCSWASCFSWQVSIAVYEWNRVTIIFSNGVLFELTDRKAECNASSGPQKYRGCLFVCIGLKMIFVSIFAIRIFVSGSRRFCGPEQNDSVFAERASGFKTLPKSYATSVCRKRPSRGLQLWLYLDRMCSLSSVSAEIIKNLYSSIFSNKWVRIHGCLETVISVAF